MKLNCLKFLAILLLAVPTTRAQQQSNQGPGQQQQQPPSQQPPSQQPNAGSTPDNAVTPLPPLPSDSNDTNGNAVPGARGLFVGIGDQAPNTDQNAPDTHVLSSPEAMGLGTPAGNYRLFDPILRASESISSGISPNHLDSITSLGGSVTFDRQWTKYRFTALYTGAETLYTPDSSLNVSYHDAVLSQQIQWNRWLVRLRNDLIIAPEASFSGLYTGSTGIAGLSAPLPSTAPVLASPETIQTGLARSLSDSVIGEVDYSISPRSTMTVTSTYGLIHFLVSGFLDSYRVGAGVGYNYSLDPKNSISIFYNYVEIGFNGQTNLLVTQLFQGAYGRKITGRLAFQLSAGPQLLQLANYGPSTGQHWSWVLSSSLNYQFNPTTSIVGSYFHQVTAGSGVFLGAESDVFTGGLNRQFARTWWGSANVGYARNSNLVPIAGASNLYNTYFGGLSVAHSLTSQLNLNLSYGFQRQTGAAGACTVLSCGLPTGLNHVGTVTIDWHPFLNRSL